MTNQEKQTEFYMKHKEGSPEDQVLAVRYCRSKPAYEKEHSKGMVVPRGRLEDMRAPLEMAMSQVGEEMKSGRDPRSGMERVLQQSREAEEDE